MPKGHAIKPTVTRGNARKRPPHSSSLAPQLGEVLDFMRELWSVGHGLQATSKRMARELGVTGPQRLVIRIIGHSQGISAGDLAAILHLHPSTLTGIVKRLEGGGYLERSRDPIDGRRAKLFLTEKGRKMNRLQAGTVEYAIQRVLEGASDAKIEAAKGLLQRLAIELGGE